MFSLSETGRNRDTYLSNDLIRNLGLSDHTSVNFSLYFAFQDLHHKWRCGRLTARVYIFQIVRSQTSNTTIGTTTTTILKNVFPRTRRQEEHSKRERGRQTKGRAKARGSQVQFRANAARMSDSREGRSRQTHPGGLGDENKLASEHQWWPCSVRFLSAELKREVARLWLRLLRQKRRLTSLISDENENEFDPFFSVSPFLRRLPFPSVCLSPSLSHDPHHAYVLVREESLFFTHIRLLASFSN